MTSAQVAGQARGAGRAGRAATDTRDVAAGTVIFEEGSHGDEMFGVVEGAVELRLPNGRDVTIGPDETFMTPTFALQVMSSPAERLPAAHRPA